MIFIIIGIKNHAQIRASFQLSDLYTANSASDQSHKTKYQTSI